VNVERSLPESGPDTAFFWSSGADGRLRFMRCSICGLYIHPPLPVCPSCAGRSIAPVEVSGEGAVVSFTVNYHPWKEEFPVPYVIAVVEMKEQAGLRLTSNIVGCDPDKVTIGMTVQVKFLENDEVYLPLFEPVI
jgi:uncharacterized OB-fold protein